MGDYPAEDEEYELMYADEFELMREREDDIETNNVRAKINHAKKSLDFSNTKEDIHNQNNDNNTVTSQDSVVNMTPMEDCFTALNANGAKKRTVDEIFGDVNDIDFTEEIPSKKQKTEEEIDAALIERIVNERKFRQFLSEPTISSKPKTSYVLEENMSMHIPRLGFIPVSNLEGQRMYVKCDSEESWEKSLDDFNYATSFDSMYTEVWEDANEILEKKADAQSQVQREYLPDIEADILNNNANLWVDKYKPESYLDLLTEEPINRTVLHWLHLWDKIVFKKEIKVTDPQHRNSFSKRTGLFQFSNKWKGKKNDTGPELDDDGRPHHKVALLCGPPGVGKTTLAHLLAKLAGYRPVELNASDERSVDAFSNALKSATLMRSVLDVEKRPNCLILDEIDGAPLQSVELLVKWCTAAAADNKKKGKSQPLRRPVIAICNDLYASALRPLRAVSLIVHVTGVSDNRLRSRLNAVCDREGLAVPPHVLAALTQRVNGDIRSATTTLQFLKNKNNITMEDVTNTNVGEKDCHKSVIQALQAVFTINDKPDPMRHVLNTINAAGEYDRIIEGIFENYPTRRTDPRLDRACTTLEWLEFYDVIQTWTVKHQNYALYSLLPLCAAGCYSILATRHHHRLQFPLQAQEVFRKKSDMQGIADALYQGTNPSVAPLRKPLVFDIISLLPYILAPKLRSANVQLCSDSERKALSDAASVMCDYGIQYIQQRNMEGFYDFQLEPQIYKLAFFGSEDRLRVPPAVRQALNREQQLEQIRRLEIQTSKGAKPTSSSTPKMKKKSVEKEDAQKSLPNHLQRLQPKIVKSAPQVHKDFFGRLVPITETKHRSDAARDLISASKVSYQYQEGYNNAVRKSVRMRDLL